MNADFDLDDVMSTLQNLTFKKSTGPDLLTNEMLFNAKDYLAPIFLNIFQFIFRNHIFPSDWTKSIILPIHKKGDMTVCNNYRPITLSSLFCKVFSSILNKRLTVFIESNNILPEEQAGFRRGYSTIDHIFTLYAMVSKCFAKNRKLYVAFIDFSKCFDSINRSALFNVLKRHGLSGDFLLTVQCMYDHVYASVKNSNTMSDYFESLVGLKQGCLISPSCFNIFIAELTRKINLYSRNGIQFSPNDPIIHHLMYADDNVLISETPVGLQQKLNTLYQQCQRLGLVVNLNKTKIIVFRKGGFLGQNEHWNYNGTPVEVVNTYSYLGVVLTTKMSFNLSKEFVIAKAKSIVYQLIRSLKINCCNDLNVFFKIFDAQVLPILAYGSELMGIFDNSDLDSIQTNAIKLFLNVSTHSSNTVTYYETGRYPISISLKIRSISYWFRLLRLPSLRFNKQAFIALDRMQEEGKRNWVSEVKDLLCSLGFSVVWFSRTVGNEKLFLKCLKQRLIDCEIQNLEMKLSESRHFAFYSSYKTFFSSHEYLRDNSMDLFLKKQLVQFRFGASIINAHRFKFSNNLNDLKCKKCSLGLIENEMHVVFECPYYEHVRHELFPSFILNQRDICSFKYLANENYMLLAKFLKTVFKNREMM